MINTDGRPTIASDPRNASQRDWPMEREPDVATQCGRVAADFMLEYRISWALEDAYGAVPPLHLVRKLIGVVRG